MRAILALSAALYLGLVVTGYGGITGWVWWPSIHHAVYNYQTLIVGIAGLSSAWLLYRQLYLQRSHHWQDIIRDYEREVDALTYVLSALQTFEWNIAKGGLLIDGRRFYPLPAEIPDAQRVADFTPVSVGSLFRGVNQHIQKHNDFSFAEPPRLDLAKSHLQTAIDVVPTLRTITIQRIDAIRKTMRNDDF